MAPTHWLRRLTWPAKSTAGRHRRCQTPGRRIRPILVEHLESRSLLASIPTAGLVSWYRAEGDAADFAGSNDGALENGTTFTAGKVGQAFQFDGVDDQITIPHNANQNTGDEFTVEAWINPSSSGHGRPIVQKRSSGNVGGYTLETTHAPFGPADGLQFVVWVEGSQQVLQTPAGVLTSGTWQHVAATYEDGATMRIFVNGIEKASALAVGGIDGSNEPLVIGRNVVIPSFAWQGAIDEIGFYSRALTAAEIQEIVAGGSVGGELVAWYRAEGNSNDSTGSNHAALVNGATFAAGKVGQAFRFDGIDDYVEAPDSTTLDFAAGAPFSIELWAFRTSEAPLQHLLGKRIACAPDDYNYQMVVGGADIPLNEWAHIAHTFDGTTYRIYINGTLTLEAGDGGGTNVSPPNDATLRIGTSGTCQASGQAFGGLLDEISIYNRALSAAEVQAIVDSDTSGKDLLLSWYRAEGNAEDEFNVHDGTLQGDLGFAAGKMGQAFHLDGIDDSVDLGSWFNLQTFTIDMWVNPAPASSQVPFADIIDNNHTDFRSWVVQYDNVGDQYHWGPVDSPIEGRAPAPIFNLTPNTWQHLAMTRDAATRENRVYLNGELVGSSTGSSDIIYDGTQFFRLGNWGGGNRNWEGLLDEVRVRPRALSQAEIQALIGPSEPPEPPPGEIQFQAATYEVQEGQPYAVLTVTRSGNLASGAHVDFDTVDGTAGQPRIRAGLGRAEDYTTTSGTLFFRSRSNVATIRVPIRDDNAIENDENFRVVLSNPSAGVTLGQNASALVTIHDNDPSLSFLSSTSQRSESVTGRAQIEVRLNASSNKTVTVRYAAVGGTATPGIDFKPAGGTLTFRPGETRKFISFTTFNDTLYEPGNETAIYELTSATNAFLGSQTRHRVTIVDNDPEPPPVDPGATPASALFIDLQSLPRQSYAQTLRGSDRDVFQVHLQAGERLALDVDPAVGFGVSSGLTSSTLTILGTDGQRVLATVGRSAEPDTGIVNGNPAYLFQAPETGDYFLKLQTSGAAVRNYRFWFHRLGISETVPDPELLAQPGAMYVWYNGSDQVGITGPTGYGFTLTGNWKQEVTTFRRTALMSQTLRAPAGDMFILSNGRGLNVPFLVESDIFIETKNQRWGNFFGEAAQQSIVFDTATGMGTLNSYLLTGVGPLMEFQTLNDPWELAMGSRIQQQRGIDIALPGVPYFIQHRPFAIDEFHAALGDLSFSEATSIFNQRTLLVDFADPMIYVTQNQAIGPFQKPLIAVSLNGNLPFTAQETPSEDVPADVTSFYGHVRVSAAGSIKIFTDFWKVPLKLPLEGTANITANLDADGDGHWLGGAGSVAQFFAGNLAAQVDVLRDVIVGVNARVAVDLNPLSHKLDVEMELGQATLVVNGPEEALWIKGHVGPGENPLAHSPLDDLVLKNNSAVEMFFERGGDYFITAEAGIDLAGADLTAQLFISQEGIRAALEGSIKWSASIDYGPGTVSGTARATIRAALAIEIDDDGDVHLAGSVSADGRLTAKIAGKSTELFEGSIEAKVRSGGLRFRFPRGVGNLDFDLF